MVSEKQLFILTGVLVLAFVGFMVFDSSKRSGADHPIDDSIPITNGGSNGGTGSGGNGGGAGGSGGSSGGSGNGEVQTVTLRATAYGYDKDTITVKAGQPVKFDFSADPGAGCGRQVIIDNVGVNLVSRNGETVSATFTPKTAGEYGFHCGMYMFRGKLLAV